MEGNLPALFNSSRTFLAVTKIYRKATVAVGEIVEKPGKDDAPQRKPL